MNWKRIFKLTGAPLMVVLLLLFGTISGGKAQEDTVTVFAAASTTNAVSEIGKLFSERKLGRFQPSFAASSTLAKQIESGAPANIYLSANEKWMDYLEERGMVDPAGRWNLLSNRIVLVAPVHSRVNQVDIVPGFDLGGLLEGGYLAMGDPDHVPAGIYGRQALESLGVWSMVSTRIARQKDVRSALAFVEREEAPLGVVYATDAALTDKVRVVGIFPENSHPQIVYPVALVRGAETSAAKKFLEFLKSPEARSIFHTYGFTFP